MAADIWLRQTSQKQSQSSYIGNILYFYKRTVIVLRVMHRCLATTTSSTTVWSRDLFSILLGYTSVVRFGVANGLIPNDYLSALNQPADHHGILTGRLASTTGAGSWCDRALANVWYQVQLFEKVTVTRLVTQGRHNVGQWVKRYTVSFATEDSIFKFYWENGVIKV